MRIAMWSGPRNLSTAMMYSFGARSDCAVWDEPFYAAYLAASGLDHPMRAEILAAGETDPANVAAQCVGAIPENKPVFYQKHMTQHMQPHFPLSWIEDMTNVFLIRDPARVVASYHAKRENPTLEDIGFKQQADIFDLLVAKGQFPLIIDSEDILANPEAALRILCAKIGLAFDPKMLNWPKGGHKEDGVWAEHWYGSVWKSTGFGKGKSEEPELSREGTALSELARPYFEKLSIRKLRVPSV